MLDQLADPHVVRPEVVPPGTDAVSFIDRHQGTLQPIYHSSKPIEVQPLRRHVYQLVGAPGRLRHTAAHFIRVEGTRQIGRRHSQLFQRQDLVVHQGDQGRDHDGGARKHGGGKLISETLATTCRSDQQDAAVGQQRFYCFPLPGPKRLEP